MANTVQINNTTPSAADVSQASFPPNAPLDFGSLKKKIFVSLMPQSTPPSPANEGDVYLDDGTNTRSGKMGPRRYNGTEWEDFGVQTLTGVVRLDDLQGVAIVSPSEGDLLGYDPVTGTWKNTNKIDGGTF